MTTTSEAAGRTALYRLYDADDQLLYVGISLNPASRWTQHANDKSWWQDIARTDVEWLPSREEALGAEVRSIQTEQPLHNVVNARVTRPEIEPPAPGQPEVGVPEAAKRLGTSRQNVLRMCLDGRISARYDKAPGLKRGRWRVPEEEVDRLKREARDTSSTEEETRG